MRKILFISTLLLVSTNSSVFLAAQENANSPVARLRSDIQRAIQNGSPTESELATLQKALGTLREAREAREQGERVDRQRVQSALMEAEKVFQSNSFRPADRQAVRHDIEDIRSRHER